MRLIDADALQHALHGLPRDSQQAEQYHASVMAAVQAAPTVIEWHDTWTESPTKRNCYLGCFMLDNGHWYFDTFAWDGRDWWIEGIGRKGAPHYWCELPNPPEVRE